VKRLLFLLALLFLCGCQANSTETEVTNVYHVTSGTEQYRGFTLDNVLHDPNLGDIHYNIYVPDSSGGGEACDLYVTLPGYEGLYFQGVGVNLKSEEFAFEAQKYNKNMIVLAPQLSDWGETSANQTIALVEYFLDCYHIGKVYANGFSGGGETMSRVLAKRPDLFTAYLHVSSQWDGDLSPVAEAKLPVYLFVGENDEYYGSQPTLDAYNTLYALYQAQGLTEDEIDQLLVLDIKKHDYFTQRGMTNEHGGGGLAAQDAAIMGWLFSW
jgi:predicted peptidase